MTSGPDRRWLVHAAVGSVLTVAYMAGPGGGAWEALYTSVAVWAAAGVAWASIGQQRTIRLGLRIAAVGLVALAIGDGVFAFYELAGRDTPFPSVADVAYLVGYVLLSAGLFAIGRLHTTREALIDACVVTAGISGVVWLSVAAPLLEPGWSLPTLVAVAYPVGSVLLLVAASQLWLGLGGRVTSIRLLAAGLLVWLVADAVYAHQVIDDTYATGGLLDLGWLAAYVLVPAGVLHPSMRTVAERRRRTAILTPHRFLLLATASAAIPAATALFDLEPVPPLMLLTVFSIVLSSVRLARPVRALRSHALSDQLTGLPNRSVLSERLADALHGLEPGEEIALLFCDLDHFKVVNDSLGHPAGDELLVEIADRFRSCTRQEDTVARLGGDEFVVLLGPGRGAAALADRLANRILERIAQPVLLASGHHVTPSLSIGIRSTGDRGADSALLISDADAAMYTAKSNGRSGAARFDPAMRQAAVDRLVVESDLRRAIDSGELRCAYQPELDLQTGALFGLEALVRWDHPQHGLLGPERFVAHAEANGMIGVVFEHVLDEALGQQRRWAGILGTHPAMSVNVSPAQRLDDVFVSTVIGALDRHGAPPEALWLAITESALVDDDLTRSLRTLRGHGVRVAVDDFGTGWSSLSRLASAQWDALKIDRSFVAQVTDATSEVVQVVAATVAMAHALGMLTVAEGVETQQELDQVRALGCDVGQGGLLAPPLEPDDVLPAVERLVGTRSAVLGQDG